MENNEKAYYEKVDIDNELKLRKQLAALPPYCKQYFIAIESKTQSRTRLAYAYDLSCFSHADPMLQIIPVNKVVFIRQSGF